jgi:hypothetical protein
VDGGDAHHAVGDPFRDGRLDVMWSDDVPQVVLNPLNELLGRPRASG